MKLMTKLFICFGVFFLLGTQAFASEITYVAVTNNCPGINAIYVREACDPNNCNFFKGYELYNSVPSGTTQALQIPLWNSKGTYVEFSAYSHSSLNSALGITLYLKPNGSQHSVTFHKEKIFGIYTGRCSVK